VLDTPGFAVPEGMARTAAAGLEHAALLDAAMTAASVLAQVTQDARRAVSFDPPTGLRAWARARLASVRRA
jgi:hypothetical protein